MFKLFLSLFKTKTYHVVLVTLQNGETYYCKVAARSEGDALDRFSRMIMHDVFPIVGNNESFSGNIKYIKAKNIVGIRWCWDSQERPD